MQTRTFLERVLAAKPNHVLTLGADRAGRKIFWNENYTDLDSLSAAALRHDTKGHTVYHAIGSFEDNIESTPTGTKITRKASQASAFKTLACDIDVGATKPYFKQIDAADALARACKLVSLPAPMIVSSGYGLHCYWPLTVEIGRAQWIALSVALRDKLTTNGLQVDTGKVCDPSMVLRPIGTSNRKGEHSLAVQLLRDCPDYLVDTLKGVLGVGTAGQAPRSAAGTPRRSAMLDAVLQSTDFPPADAAQLVLKCGQLGQVASSRGNVPEPLWYLALGVANHCIDTEAVAIRWSDGHPKYTEAETLRKLQQWKKNTTGPATCVGFEHANPDVCKKCIHRGNITTPVQLSVPKADTLAPEVILPPGYQITNGRVLRVLGGVATPICNFPLIVKERYFDVNTGKALALIEARMPIEGVKEIELPIDTIAAGKEKWTGFLFNNSIAPGPSEKHIAGTRQYIMTYLEELQRKSKPIDTYSHFGWAEDGGFILGARRFCAGKIQSVELSQSITTDMRAAYEPHGALGMWVDAIDYYGEPGMEHHAMCLLIGMGAPLLAYTDLDGFVVSMYSPQTGTGKTTTGHMINSIWGHPKLIQIGRNDTMNAMYHTLVQQANLPAYFEEITTMPGEEVSDFVYNVAHGRERRRMTEMAKMREAGKWKLPVFTSSNRSLVAKLENNKLSSEGELQRIIEYPFSPNTVFDGTKDGTPTGLKITSLLRENHGLAGPQLLQAYTKIPDLRALVLGAYGAFKKEFDFDFNAKERYAQAAHVIAYIAAKVGTKLGIVRFDCRPVIERSLNHIRSAQEDSDTNRSNAFDIIGMFTVEHTASTVYERTDLTQARAIPLQGQATTRGEIRARFELTHRGGKLEAGSFFVDRAHFNRWCQERGVDVSDVVRQLGIHGVKVRATRLSLGRRTAFVTSSIWCYQIDLMHHEFITRLAGIDQFRENTMLAAVK